MSHVFPPLVRRLLLILAVLVALGMGLSGLYLFQTARLDANAKHHRQVGLEAFAREDYPQALDQLGRSLQRNPEDVQALYQYAQSRQRVAMPNGRHWVHAASALRKVLEMDPHYPGAALDLLGLYRRLGYQVEAIELADVMLANDPNNASALRAKATALVGLRQYKQAMPVITQALENDPLDYMMQALALATLDQLGASAQQLTDHANRMAQAYPDDPRTLFVQALAAQRVGHFDAMMKLLRRAVEMDPTDVAYVTTLVRLLDTFNLYSLSLKALKRADQTLADPLMSREIILRYFENEQYARAAGLIDRSRRQAGDTYLDPTLLAIQALSLQQIDRLAPARAIARRLANREHDPLAQVWARVLQDQWDDNQGSPAKKIQTLQEAIALAPNTACLHLLLGDVYQHAQEPELALRAWKHAAQLSRPWALPRSRQVRTLLKQGRADDALAQAQAALRRQPENPRSAIAWTLARAATLRHAPDDARQLLHAVNAIHRLVPDDELTLLLRLQLMLQIGQVDNARETLTYALNHNPNLSAATLIQLAQCIDPVDPPLADALLDRCQRDHHLTASLALAQSLRRIQKGQPAEAQRYFDFADQTPSDSPPSHRDWSLARCQLLEALHDPHANTAWRDLLHRFPDYADVARQALKAPSVLSDRPLWNLAIEQLRRATGDQAIGWRLHRARWLLKDPKPTAASRRDAIALLQQTLALAPVRIEASVMLADVFIQLRQPQLALRELTLAHHHRPDVSSLVLDIAALQETLHEYTLAQDQYTIALSQNPDDPDTLRRASAFFARRGQFNRAAELLLQLDRAQRATPNDLLLLAQCYAQLHAPKKVQALASQLAEHPPDPTGLAWLAQYFHDQHDNRWAPLFEKRLDAQPISAARRLYLKAQATHDLTQTRTLLEQALAQEPDDPATRQALMAVLLKLGDVTSALTFEELKPDQAWIRRFGPTPALRPILSALVGDAESRAAAVATLTLLSNEQLAADPQAAAAALRDLARRYRYVKPLVAWVIQHDMAEGHPDQAAALATQSVELFPRDSAMVRLMIEAFVASEQWPQVLTAAPLLRERDPQSAPWADLQLAQAQTQLGLGLRATQTLGPYLRQAINNPQANRPVIDAYVAALRADGRDAQAQRFLHAVGTLPPAPDRPQAPED